MLPSVTPTSPPTPAPPLPFTTPLEKLLVTFPVWSTPTKPPVPALPLTLPVLKLLLTPADPATPTKLPVEAAPTTLPFRRPIFVMGVVPVVVAKKPVPA